MLIGAGAASDAQALSERTVVLVDVPLPSFAERRAAWESLTGSASVERLSPPSSGYRSEQIRAAAEVSLLCRSSARR